MTGPALQSDSIPAVSVQALSKSFGRVTALDEVSLDIPTGSVFGLLGPNGSGKTTLLSILCGFLRPTAGEATLFGRPVDHGLSRMGAIVGEPSHWAHLSMWDNLRCARGIYATGESDQELSAILDGVGLESAVRTRRFRDCSTGMKQRLAIGVALLGDPDILVFDEPTNGLDPRGIADMRNMVQSLSRRHDGSRRTVILASHLLNEVEQVCDYVGVLNRGRQLYCGPIDGLTTTARYQVETTDNPAAIAILKAQGWQAQITGDSLTVGLSDGSPARISEVLARNEIFLSRLQAVASVEAGFFELLSSEDS